MVLLLAAGLFLAGCGSLTSYAAKVNGQRITQNELDRELNAILGNKAYLEQVDQGFAQQTGERAIGTGKGTLNTVFVARVLERRIAYELIRQELNRRKLTVTPNDVEQARKELVESLEDEKILEAFPKGYRDELLRSNAQVAVLQRFLERGRGDEAAVKDFYDKNRAAFQLNCVRHILVPDRALALRIKQRIAAGEDFAAIARAESKDNQGPDGGSAAKGGDLGCPPSGSLVAAFEAAANSLQPGQVSDPVQTEFGFHVIQLVERKTRSLEEATPDIRRQLHPETADALRTFVDESFAKAEITVNPRYGEFVKSGAETGIKPPKETTPSTPTPDLAPQQ